VLSRIFVARDIRYPESYSRPIMWNFTCNICGQPGVFRQEHCINPELPSCSGCGSNVRFRWLVHQLSREIFGDSMPLVQFPPNSSVKGIGLSDPACIANPLTDCFTYRNTCFHAEPHLDIRVDPSPIGELDFLIASEVFEHIEPPVAQAFRNAATLLKPSGVLLLTVPWVWDGSEPLPELYDWKLHKEGEEWIVVNRTADEQTERFSGLSFNDGPGPSLGYTREHFPQLHEWTVSQEGESRRLLNKRPDGSIEIFHNLVFHRGPGSALEMRLFTKRGLENHLREAGFAKVEFAFEDHPEFGIIFAYPWSRPIVARLG